MKTFVSYKLQIDNFINSRILCHNIFLILHTVRYLKPIQVYYQIWYRIKNKLNIGHRFNKHCKKVVALRWIDGIYNPSTYQGSNTFEFINLKKKFKQAIDWNYKKHKKLWTYNLTYFDFLNQEKISKKEGLVLINDFVKNYAILKDAKEPYPTSLRIINWIKFIAKHKIEDQSILQTIKQDSNRLNSNLEYHLLGNHLLENGFALWFSAHLFKDEECLKKARKLLQNQLNEQILNDGGHFELSPMYHQLMLYRVLDCIRLAELNSLGSVKMISFFRDKASEMISWLEHMTFNNGNIPLFNDAANAITPKSFNIFAYAKALNIKSANIPLSDSGYRKFLNNNYELICDVGELGPSYQPGHSHADTFNFELYINDEPILVDSGISTYNIGVERSSERSTKAHNTVSVNSLNSSQVWGGFRVAKRANVKILKDSDVIIIATHDGFKELKTIHERRWLLRKNQIEINDVLSNMTVDGTCYLHFHPSVINLSLEENKLVSDNFTIYFEGEVVKIILKKYKYNNQFNSPQTAFLLEVNFITKLNTIIQV